MRHPIKLPDQHGKTSIITDEAFPGHLALDLRDLDDPWQERLKDYYQNAWELALKLPFPAKKSEAWRRTDLSRLDFAKLTMASAQAGFFAAPEMAPLPFEVGNDALAAMLIVGPYGSQLSQTAEAQAAGAIFMDFRSAEKSHPELLARAAGSLIPAEQGKFAAISTALGRDGAFLYVPEKASFEAPFLISIEAGPASGALFSHVVLWLEDGAQASVSLHYSSSSNIEAGQSFHGGLVEIHLGKDAVLNLSETQDFGPNLWNVTYEKAQIADNGRLQWTYGSLGSCFTKGFVTVDLLAAGAQAQIDGFNFSNGRQQIDLDTRQNHLAEHTTSNLLFKGAVNGRSKTVWQGMIYVAPEAMGTDAYQSNRSLVLSDAAEVNAIPGLEILADDVRCSHGATVGKLDEEEIFYFESRGISRGDAEKLLVEAFFAEVIEKDISPAHQEVLKDKIRAKLE